MRDTIPAEEFRYIVFVNRGQCIEPVDARDNVSGFKFVKSAWWYQEFRIPESLRKHDARPMHVAQTQTEHQTQSPQPLTGPASPIWTQTTYLVDSSHGRGTPKNLSQSKVRLFRGHTSIAREGKRLPIVPSIFVIVA